MKMLLLLLSLPPSLSTIIIIIITIIIIIIVIIINYCHWQANIPLFYEMRDWKFRWTGVFFSKETSHS